MEMWDSVRPAEGGGSCVGEAIREVNEGVSREEKRLSYCLAC